MGGVFMMANIFVLGAHARRRNMIRDRHNEFWVIDKDKADNQEYYTKAAAVEAAIALNEIYGDGEYYVVHRIIVDHDVPLKKKEK